LPSFHTIGSAAILLQRTSAEIEKVLDTVRDEAPEEFPGYCGALAPVLGAVFEGLEIVRRLDPNSVRPSNPNAVSGADLNALEREALAYASTYESWKSTSTMGRNTALRIVSDLVGAKNDLQQALPLITAVVEGSGVDSVRAEWHSAVNALDSLLDRLGTQHPDLR
jgi:hypothetical protein